MSSDTSSFASTLSIIPVITAITIIIELVVAIQSFWHKRRVPLYFLFGEPGRAVAAVAEGSASGEATNPQRSVCLCLWRGQEETSVEGSGSGDTGKAQGGSVPQGRRADCDQGDRPSRRGERESEK